MERVTTIFFVHIIKMSVDFGLMARLIVDAFDQKEKFEQEKVYPVDLLGYVDFAEIQRLERKLKTRDIAQITSIILSIVFGAFAFYLSWTCNTALGYNAAVRAVFGITAFLFGFTYIVLYMLLRYDTCNAIMKK